METTNIYSLTDPISGKIRYIGKANNLKQRLKAHCNPARYRPTHKHNWVKKLRASGLKPIMTLVEVVNIEEWKEREKYWISYYIEQGCNLVNYTGGGDGLTHGNKTSFKKGNVPWNAGAARLVEAICCICNKNFQYPESEKSKKTCSKECTAKLKSINSNSGKFAKGITPWNADKSGYPLGGLKKARRVFKQDPQNRDIVETFRSVTEAAASIAVCHETMRKACITENKVVRNYIWNYE